MNDTGEASKERLCLSQARATRGGWGWTIIHAQVPWVAAPQLARALQGWQGRRRHDEICTEKGSWVVSAFVIAMLGMALLPE
jgi:hypothetical protein